MPAGPPHGQVGKPVVTVLIVASLACAAVAGPQTPTIGPQIRVDPNGGNAAANETTVAVTELYPDRLFVGFNDYRDAGFIRNAFWDWLVTRHQPQRQALISGERPRSIAYAAGPEAARQHPLRRA